MLDKVQFRQLVPKVETFGPCPRYRSPLSDTVNTHHKPCPKLPHITMSMEFISPIHHGATCEKSETSATDSHCSLFVSACRKVTAVRLRLQAFGRKRSRSEASCCSHEKPGLKTGKPKLAATRYCPVKKASRGTALKSYFTGFVEAGPSV